MKKLVSALLAIFAMLTLPLFAYADIPALPPQPEHKDASGIIVLIVVVVILIGGAILIRLLRKKK